MLRRRKLVLLLLLPPPGPCRHRPAEKNRGDRKSVDGVPARLLLLLPAAPSPPQTRRAWAGAAAVAANAAASTSRRIQTIRNMIHLLPISINKKCYYLFLILTSNATPKREPQTMKAVRQPFAPSSTSDGTISPGGGGGGGEKGAGGAGDVGL